MHAKQINSHIFLPMCRFKKSYALWWNYLVCRCHPWRSKCYHQNSLTGFESFCAQEPFSNQAGAGECCVPPDVYIMVLKSKMVSHIEGTVILNQIPHLSIFFYQHMKASCMHTVYAQSAIMSRSHSVDACGGEAGLCASILKKTPSTQRGARVCGAVARRLRHSAVSCALHAVKCEKISQTETNTAARVGRTQLTSCFDSGDACWKLRRYWAGTITTIELGVLKAKGGAG